MKTKRIKIQSIIYLVCSILTMAAIFAFSSQPLSESTKVSDVIVKPVESRVETAVRASDTSFESEQAENDYFSRLYVRVQTLIRKSAHIIIYALLALFVFLFFTSIDIGSITSAFITLVFCILYAAGDEFHQSFVDLRHATPHDVLIDAVGAICMLIVVLLIKKAASAAKNRDRNGGPA